MAFVWTTLPATALQTKPSSAIITEVRANINTDRASVGLGATSWTKTITPGIKIETAEYTEMKSSLDAAYDANTCGSDNLTHNGTYDNNEEIEIRSYHDSAYLNEDNGTYESSYEDAVRAVHYSDDLGVFNGEF